MWQRSLEDLFPCFFAKAAPNIQYTFQYHHLLAEPMLIGFAMLLRNDEHIVVVLALGKHYNVFPYLSEIVRSSCLCSFSQLIDVVRFPHVQRRNKTTLSFTFEIRWLERFFGYFILRWFYA